MSYELAVVRCQAWRLKISISMLKRCHPETCPSAGEGPSFF
jgi:hypothetical protein